MVHIYGTKCLIYDDSAHEEKERDHLSVGITKLASLLLPLFTKGVIILPIIIIKIKKINHVTAVDGYGGE